MKNIFKLFGLIALVAVIVFSMAACGDGTTNEGEGGTFTLNGIPPEYNGQYAFLNVVDSFDGFTIFGVQNINMHIPGSYAHMQDVALALPRISNGSVTIPMYKGIWTDTGNTSSVRYSGNDTVNYVRISIYSEAPFNYKNRTGIIEFYVVPTTFVNGSATRICYQDSNGDDTNPFIGTWTKADESISTSYRTMIFTETTWTMTTGWGDDPANNIQGTLYTHNGNIAALYGYSYTSISLEEISDDRTLYYKATISGNTITVVLAHDDSEVNFIGEKTSSSTLPAQTFNSIIQFQEWAAELVKNNQNKSTATNPYNIKLILSDTGIGNGDGSPGKVLSSNRIYANLDFSQCNFTKIEGIGAFNSYLTGITLPESLQTIESFAFMGCSNLPSIIIPAGVTQLGDLSLVSYNGDGTGVFLMCPNLTAINVHPDNTKYSSQDGVLYNYDKTTLSQYPAGKKDTSFSIPGSVKLIGNQALSDCNNLTSVTIPYGVETIKTGAFGDCVNLAYVNLPESIKEIGSLAFEDCTRFIGITIPASVTKIGSQAFKGCSNLTVVTFATGSNIADTYFESDAFPPGNDSLKNAYKTGRAGTYQRSAGGNSWTKQQ